MSVREPIFILAAPRSFTSLISTMLGQHPEAYGVPELNLFVADTIEQWLYYFYYVAKHRRIHGLLRTICQLYAGEQTIESVAMAHRWILTRFNSSTSDVYWEFCHQVAPLRIVDKSPYYCQSPENLYRIQQTFPSAHYIHLIRHPRPQGQSAMKLFRSNGDPQHLWYRAQHNILDFLSTVPADRQMRLRGEDLLNDPRSHFKKICHWLDFAWDESILEAMLRPQDSPYACLGPYGANLGNDPNFLRSPAYRYRPVAYSQLDGPLPWRQDNKGFLPPVIKLAQEFGYD